ncbi:hypothetical protein VP01_1022g1 [Puccinia sorghi]|uniref:Uncharacterized protein n=1 Tax=Puccinia sorghi TaxID=27349 RepID=A0A0L6VW43_9BASI|nr:hypothetical protein VP01_1022g1 [Puccinia sorghi]
MAGNCDTNVFMALACKCFLRNKFDYLKHIVIMYWLLEAAAGRWVSSLQAWGRVEAGVAHLLRRKKRKLAFRGYLVGLPRSSVCFCGWVFERSTPHQIKALFLIPISHCRNIMNFTFKFFESHTAELNQLCGFCEASVIRVSRSFYSYSQCNHSMKKVYQGHKMVTIADMIYDHFKKKNKSLSVNHNIFIWILYILLEFKYNFKKNWMSKCCIKLVVELEINKIYNQLHPDFNLTCSVLQTNVAEVTNSDTETLVLGALISDVVAPVRRIFFPCLKKILFLFHHISVSLDRGKPQSSMPDKIYSNNMGMMHNWYEGVLKHHFQIWWGFNAKTNTPDSKISTNDDSNSDDLPDKNSTLTNTEKANLQPVSGSLFAKHLPLLALLNNLCSLIECTQFFESRLITEQATLLEDFPDQIIIIFTLASFLANLNFSTHNLLGKTFARCDDEVKEHNWLIQVCSLEKQAKWKKSQSSVRLHQIKTRLTPTCFITGKYRIQLVQRSPIAIEIKNGMPVPAKNPQNGVWWDCSGHQSCGFVIDIFRVPELEDGSTQVIIKTTDLVELRQVLILLQSYTCKINWRAVCIPRAVVGENKKPQSPEGLAHITPMINQSEIPSPTPHALMTLILRQIHPSIPGEIGDKKEVGQKSTPRIPPCQAHLLANLRSSLSINILPWLLSMKAISSSFSYTYFSSLPEVSNKSTSSSKLLLSLLSFPLSELYWLSSIRWVRSYLVVLCAQYFLLNFLSLIF